MIVEPDVSAPVVAEAVKNTVQFPVAPTVVVEGSKLRVPVLSMVVGVVKVIVAEEGDDVESAEVEIEKSDSFTEPLAGFVKPSR